MTVHFIGAGPGDPDLITVRGRDLIARCPVVLYAGSLVPRAVVAHAPRDAKVVDTAPLALDEIIAHIESAHEAGQDVARVHSGDPSLYGAVAELTPHYGADCPVVVAVRVGWPDQQVIRGTLADIAAVVRTAKVTRTALILVGRVFESADFSDSRLYAADHHHILRPGRKAAR
jgi:precorrin-4/cobalt-precorrin-4 C11-methyltransferase